jgi:hypothetical protein
MHRTLVQQVQRRQRDRRARQRARPPPVLPVRVRFARRPRRPTAPRVRFRDNRGNELLILDHSTLSTSRYIATQLAIRRERVERDLAPRPETLLDETLKLHDKIMKTKRGKHREREVAELERAALRRLPAT